MRFKYFAPLLQRPAFYLLWHPLFAQEGEMTVVDEVIAQVNDDVITLSMLKQRLKNASKR